MSRICSMEFHPMCLISHHLCLSPSSGLQILPSAWRLLLRQYDSEMLLTWSRHYPALTNGGLGFRVCQQLFIPHDWLSDTWFMSQIKWVNRSLCAAEASSQKEVGRLLRLISVVALMSQLAARGVWHSHMFNATNARFFSPSKDAEEPGGGGGNEQRTPLTWTAQPSFCPPLPARREEEDLKDTSR